MSMLRRLGFLIVTLIGLTGGAIAAPTTDWSINSSKYGNTSSGWAQYDSSGRIVGLKLTTPTINGGSASGMNLYSPTVFTPVLHSPTSADVITDLPGATTTTVPTTAWVDANYMPQNAFAKTSTVTVCSSGCNYTSPQDAWSYVKGLLVRDPEERITIQISDGTYTFSAPWVIDDQDFSRVSIVGDVADRTKVVLNFTNTKGTTSDGIHITGNLGLLDGVTITSPSDGTAAVSTISTDGLDISWNTGSQSAGLSIGNGGKVTIGSHVAISDFYYGIWADAGSHVSGNSLQISNTAYGVYAQNGTSVDCTSCIISVSSDGGSGSNIKAVTKSLITLTGGTFTGARGDSIYTSLGSTTYVKSASVTCSTKAVTSSTNGIHVDMGSNAYVSQSTVQGCYNGIDVEQNAMAHLDTVTAKNNTTTGVFAGLHGYVYGTSVKTVSNSGSAFASVTGSALYVTASGALASGNGSLLVQDTTTSTDTTSGAVTQPASAFIN